MPPVVVAAPADAGCEALTYPRPEPEIAEVGVEVDLPAVPRLELPIMANGERSVRELQVSGGALLDTEVTVRGYVSWIYDCFAALRANPDYADRTDASIHKYIGAEPDRYCRRPLFRIAMVPDALDAGFKVVGVPRHPTKTEKKALPKSELADKSIWRPVPALKVGDEVVVTGTWTQRSVATGETDTGGLVVYGSLINVTQGWPR